MKLQRRKGESICKNAKHREDFQSEDFFNKLRGISLMKTFFDHKRSTLLIEAAISLLILSAIVAEFIGAPLAAQARMASQNCTNVSQNYPYSNIWPSVSPELLKKTSQELMAKTGNTIGTQQIYLQLTSDSNCSLATLLQKKYKVTQAYDLEKLILATALPAAAGRWIMSQKNQTLVDNWISLAILTHSSSIPTSSFSNTDYLNALNVFCNVFQHDTTNYLYGTVTSAHLQTMVSNLRNSAGNSVSALALGLGASANPHIISPDIFEKEELQKARQVIDNKPSSITPCPGSESRSKAKPALDDFVTHKMTTLSIPDIDSFFSQATLFSPERTSKL